MEEIIQKLKLCFRKSHRVSDLEIKFQILTTQVTSWPRTNGATIGEHFIANDRNLKIYFPLLSFIFPFSSYHYCVVQNQNSIY